MIFMCNRWSVPLWFLRKGDFRSWSSLSLSKPCWHMTFITRQLLFNSCFFFPCHSPFQSKLSTSYFTRANLFPYGPLSFCTHRFQQSEHSHRVENKYHLLHKWYMWWGYLTVVFKFGDKPLRWHCCWCIVFTHTGCFSARLTWDNEAGAIALSGLSCVPVACHTPVVVQPVFHLHIQDIQGSHGCDEKPWHWRKTDK